MILTLSRLTRPAFWLVLVVAYVCAILPGGPQLAGGDKNTHLIAFATLALLARWAWPSRSIMSVATALIGFGVVIELSQAMPFIHRDADIMDVGADTIGIAIGLGLAFILLRLVRRRGQRASRA